MLNNILKTQTNSSCRRRPVSSVFLFKLFNLIEIQNRTLHYAEDTGSRIGVRDDGSWNAIHFLQPTFNMIKIAQMLQLLINQHEQ